MLQRAASNAYSWWWASHIRTKQSKWLEQNLQDMEEKVGDTLKLISEDGDSFAKRAEMYYKKRPELINFVEETYRAYRALAERYDKLSTELQNANNTIATCFPEQVQFAMDDDDDDTTPRMSKRPPDFPKSNIPKVPATPAKDIKSVITSAAKKLHPTKSSKKLGAANVSKSGLEKDEGLQEIDKLQKQILTLQTEKEYVKSFYEGQLAKYWDIEGLIGEVQEKVVDLQDEFGEGMVIEDEEARSLMAAAALKSCEESLVQLENKQEKSKAEIKTQGKKVKKGRKKLKYMKVIKTDEDESEKTADEADEEVDNRPKGRQELDELREKMKDHFLVGSNASLTVTEMAEKIDELVTKVVSLESEAASQTSLIERLRAETDELLKQVQKLEDDKATLIDSKNDLNNKLVEMEEKLRGLEDVNRNVEEQNNNLQTQLSDKMQDGQVGASNPPNNLKKMMGVKFSDDLQVPYADEKEKTSPVKGTPSTDGTEKPDEKTDVVNVHEKARDVKTEVVNVKERDLSGAPGNQEVLSQSRENETQGQQASSQALQSVGKQENVTEKEGEPDWKRMFMKGMGNREQTLLAEYTTVLRNYKELKKKHDETEMKPGDSDLDTATQLKELRSANNRKDGEIRHLREKLDMLHRGLNVSNDLHEGYSDAKEEDFRDIQVDEPETISPVEEKFRGHIDGLLEENLNFWLKFSTAFHEIPKFDTEVKDLQADLKKLEKKKRKHEGSGSSKYIKADGRPLYRHLREIQTELSVWMEKSASLKEELKTRFSSLCEIQEEITKALKLSAEDDDFKFTSYQAAKFQGEVLNMKQENNRVADELQAGLDHITNLQLEVEKTLVSMSESFGINDQKNRPSHLTHSNSASQVPLRSFIFGVKPKKQKGSFLSCVHPALQKKYNGFRSGLAG